MICLSLFFAKNTVILNFTGCRLDFYDDDKLRLSLPSLGFAHITTTESIPLDGVFPTTMLEVAELPPATFIRNSKTKVYYVVSRDIAFMLSQVRHDLLYPEDVLDKRFGVICCRKLAHAYCIV